MMFESMTQYERRLKLGHIDRIRIYPVFRPSRMPDGRIYIRVKRDLTPDKMLKIRERIGENVFCGFLFLNTRR